MSQAVKLVYGSAMVGRSKGMNEPHHIEEILKVLKEENVTTIDTAKAYGDSEKMLGGAGAATKFEVDTKAPGGFIPGNSTGDEVIQAATQSLDKLKTDKVNIYYLHSPDDKVPLSDTLEGVQKLYKDGKFKYFGLSNYEAQDVRKVYEHCKENGYVLPTVYQGNYSAVARKPETELFPTLRELGMSFYAYSPIAGGFLTKTKQQILDGEGRFDSSTAPGAMYSSLYNKDSYLSILEEWEGIANDAGCSKSELAYRWVRYNSGLNAKDGDAMIFGARNIDQLKDTLKGINTGPLNEAIADRINALWPKLEADAPLDNYNSYLKGLRKS